MEAEFADINRVYFIALQNSLTKRNTELISYINTSNYQKYSEDYTYFY